MVDVGCWHPLSGICIGDVGWGMLDPDIFYLCLGIGDVEFWHFL